MEYVNASLIQDLERQLGTKSLWDWIECESERLGAKGRSSSGYVSFSESLLRDRRIIEIRENQEKVVGRATIERDKSGNYIIRISKGLPFIPKRFSIAHEIGHTYWCSDSTGRPLSFYQRELGRDQTIEYLCNRYAAALLLPLSSIVPYLGVAMGTFPAELVKISLIPLLADRFKLPEEAVAVRLFSEIESNNVAVVCLRRSRDKKSIGPLFDASGPEKWQTLWARIPTSFQAYRSDSECFFSLKPARRIVPVELIPKLVLNAPQEIELDTLWWDLVRPVGKVGETLPLRSRPHDRFRRAFGLSTKTNMYIVIPHGE